MAHECRDQACGEAREPVDHSVRKKRVRDLRIVSSDATKQVNRQQRHVLLPRGQWRHVQPKRKPGQHIVFQNVERPVGRGDQTEVRVPGPGLAEAGVLPRVQHTEQACLHLDGQLTELVQEQGAAVRLSDQTRARCHSRVWIVSEIPEQLGVRE